MNYKKEYELNSLKEKKSQNDILTKLKLEKKSN